MYKLANGWTKDTVREQVRKYNNGSQAKNKLGTCTYNAKDGNRCFIGAFIPNNHPALDSTKSIGQILVRYPELEKCLPFKGFKAINDFQFAHDNADSTSLFVENCAYLALEHFLDEKVA